MVMMIHFLHLKKVNMMKMFCRSNVNERIKKLNGISLRNIFFNIHISNNRFIMIYEVVKYF